MTGQGTDPFLEAFRGRFYSVLRWEQFDRLWEILRRDAGGGWYIYAVGEPAPGGPAAAALVEAFLAEVGELLRREHDEDYCGIVYADSLETPALVKIFDPHHLGVSCGFSEHPPLPGWILSKLPPVDLASAAPLPGSRRRWWRRLLGR